MSSTSTPPVLLPRPRKLDWREGFHAIGQRPWCVNDPQAMLGTAEPLLASAWRTAGEGAHAINAANASALEVIHAADLPAEGYRLNIKADSIALSASTRAGAYYGAMTLLQLLRQTRDGRLHCLSIEDAPCFARRGLMLDVSRDRVPTMPTLLALIEKLAELKYNELQLYTEHTFAYEGHQTAWLEASPLTAAEIKELHVFCRARHIELVPNQNCFGHMERWLKHERYRPLAECPDGYTSHWGPWTEPPGVLCPEDPASLALIDDLLGQLLPLFESERVNVGCDETWELGKGRSAERAEAEGVGRVYLDYLLKVAELARKRGKRAMFWGDIILEHPELIDELPRDLIPVCWGYEANHPFEDQLARFAAAGLEFYVAPGTSSWNSIAGRTTNMLQNLHAAALAGQRHGATGYLVTDWGDNGHAQHAPVAWPGYAWGAAQAWAPEANASFDLAAALDCHVFYDDARLLGQTMIELGDLYRETGCEFPNATLLHLLIWRPDQPLHRGRFLPHRFDPPTNESFMRVLARLDEIAPRLAHAHPRREDARDLLDECVNTCALLRHACKLGLARLASPEAEIEALPELTRKQLALQLKVTLAVWRRLWSVRSRPGGLRESAARLEKLLGKYEA